VVIVSSISALRGSELIGAYDISKAADLALARNLAVEWGPRNVRVNCVALGLVRTDFARALWEDPQMLAKRTERTPASAFGMVLTAVIPRRGCHALDELAASERGHGIFAGARTLEDVAALVDDALDVAGLAGCPADR
jgi:enoyl-[acyl-carrier-protein] reductase (NADH)